MKSLVVDSFSPDTAVWQEWFSDEQGSPRQEGQREETILIMGMTIIVIAIIVRMYDVACEALT